MSLFSGLKKSTPEDMGTQLIQEGILKPMQDLGLDNETQIALLEKIKGAPIESMQKLADALQILLALHSEKMIEDLDAVLAAHDKTVNDPEYQEKMQRAGADLIEEKKTAAMRKIATTEQAHLNKETADAEQQRADALAKALKDIQGL